MTTADAVVVGSGVIGCAIALELARGGFRVVVVDRSGGAGHGSTSASSAIVRFTYSTWDGVATSWEAMRYWERWRDHLEAGAAEQLARFRKTGMVLIDAPRDGYPSLFARAGVPYEQWDPPALAANLPGIDTGRYGPPARLSDERFWAPPHGQLGALSTPDAGYVDDPLLAAENLAAAARRHGTRFVYRQTVTEVLRGGDRVSGVRLAGGETISAPVVVNAAGPWSALVNRAAGVGADFTIGVRPVRQEVHHVRVPDPGWHTILADLDLGVYVRPDSNGLLIGGTEPECDPPEWLDDPDDAGAHPTQAVFDAQVTRAARRFPGIGMPSRPSGIVGVYDVADDWTPIYDRTELPGFYVAMGTSGNQFKNAPLVGEFLAAIITAVENGADHDRDPVRFTGTHTGHSINLGAFSRKRPINTANTGTVLG